MPKKTAVGQRKPTGGSRKSVAGAEGQLPRDWAQRRRRIIERDGGMCQIAGPRCTGRGTEVDHIKPRQFGGSHEDSNLRLTCRTCHRELSIGPQVPYEWA